MELSPRLMAIARSVPNGAKLADVGTDHGYLPVWLLLNDVVHFAIAADLREGPLERAKETALRHGQTERISFRLCDGLTGIQAEEADTIVIAGMGGETIASILAAAPWTHEDKLLLLQPMTGIPQLRQWLQCHDFSIISEEITCEGEKLYISMIVKGGRMLPLSPAEQWAGINTYAPLRLKYLTLVEEKVQKALHGHRAARMADLEAIAQLEAVTAGLEEMKKELSQ